MTVAVNGQTILFIRLTRIPKCILPASLHERNIQLPSYKLLHARKN